MSLELQWGLFEENLLTGPLKIHLLSFIKAFLYCYRREIYPNNGQDPEQPHLL